MNIQEWIEKCNEMQTCEKNNMPVYEASRGKFYLFEPQLVQSDVNIFISNVSLRVTSIATAEAHWWFSGREMPLDIKDELYANDGDIYNQYGKLQLYRLDETMSRRSSRNNIIQNQYCCMSSWQLYDDTLHVYSRSMDIARAGRTDVIAALIVAVWLRAKKVSIYIANPHVYLDTTKIARRRT